MLHNVLMNQKWLKEFSIYPLNYNTKELENYIKLAETIWLEPVIGSDWYEQLLDQVANNNLSEANSTALVEAIYPYLGFAIAYEALPTSWAHVSEIGITKGKSDNSDSLTLKEMGQIHEHIRRQLEARKDYLKKWVCERSASFPLICGCQCDCNCCCGGSKGKLNAPNKLQRLYSPYRRCTDIR